jgi:hypothetical protein
MGYKTRISPPGSDRGKDVEASFLLLNGSPVHN